MLDIKLKSALNIILQPKLSTPYPRVQASLYFPSTFLAMPAIHAIYTYTIGVVKG